ncbi:MAG: sigma-70 family RNA polymerase sigma factor [Sedimentisphaerales bacterium]|nr:sigma-70 family RNA polymerase sigma factor [Sedimentisphaerales bacterium]
MMEEKLLILRFKRGRPEALRQIYDKYKVELLRYAMTLVGNLYTAEDIVHDVFVSFAQSADRIGLTGSLKGYLVASVLNRVRNHVRDGNRHGEGPLDEADLLPSREAEPQQWAILSEEMSLLSKALQQLPYEQREVICSHMEMDLTFSQIAVLQKASVNTVKGRYRYGIERLRSVLNGKVHE